MFSRRSDQESGRLKLPFRFQRKKGGVTLLDCSQNDARLMKTLNPREIKCHQPPLYLDAGAPNFLQRPSGFWGARRMMMTVGCEANAVGDCHVSQLFFYSALSDSEA